MKDRYVLLVDDEVNIVNALTRELHGWAAGKRLSFLTAASGKEGLAELAEKGAETILIISDLRMPEMKGSEFLLEAKKLYPTIVTILLTGYSDAQEIAKAVSAGIFSYLLKPWDRDYLIAEIDKAFSYHELLASEALSKKRLDEELKWAGEMQKAILKPNLPSSSGVEFRVSYRPLPSMRCGGDYYDVVFMGPEKYLLLIGDVAGHGVRAAFVTGILKAIIYPEFLRSYAGKSVPPGEFLGWLNQRMNFELRSASGLIITFFAGFLDLKERSFRYANAGQTKPFLVREGKAAELPVSSPAIGFSQNVHYPEQSFGVLEGDLFFLYTDGLSEVGAAEGSGSIVDVKRLLEKTPYAPDFQKKILEGALAEGSAADFSDDVAILSAKVGKSGS
jgi:sigma-B regulation protein RsbU (phosphoserine phosphatase)